MNLGRIELEILDNRVRQLFSEQDRQARAIALQREVLPHLHLLLSESIDRIEPETQRPVLADSTRIASPAFRKSGLVRPFTWEYDRAASGLGGRRRAGYWNTIEPDSSTAVYAPMLLRFELGSQGLCVALVVAAYHARKSAWRRAAATALERSHATLEIIRKRFGLSVSALPAAKPDLQSVPSRFETRRLPFPISTSDQARAIQAFVALYPVYEQLSWAARGLRGEFDRLHPDELDPSGPYVEGARKSVLVNAFERDSAARGACLVHYGHRCSVCDVKLDERYGPAAHELIHVHHLKPLTTIGKRYCVDPKKDLVPVCPNCHAVMHRRSPEPYSVSEVRAMLARSSLTVSPRTRASTTK